MQKSISLAFVAFLLFALNQTYAEPQSSETNDLSVNSEMQKVYFNDHEVTLPSLIETQSAFAKVKKCSADFRGSVNLIVDKHGLPRDLHVIRSVEPSLDQQAIETVRGYRFKPAFKAGRPVAVLIQVAVRFQAY